MLLDEFSVAASKDTLKGLNEGGVFVAVRREDGLYLQADGLFDQIPIFGGEMSMWSGYELPQGCDFVEVRLKITFTIESLGW